MSQNKPEKNKLYYGDNYEVLQRYVRDESVDLVYLDPPLNSRQNYNVLFAEKDGSTANSPNIPSIVATRPSSRPLKPARRAKI